MNSIKDARYTLLADDNLQISMDSRKIKQFKSHLVLNLIFHDQVVFSDSQIICSRNLRQLTRLDSTFQELLKQNCFALAIRSNVDADNLGPMDILDVEKAFRQEGKIDQNSDFYKNLRELQEFQEHASLIPWEYKNVRNSFTENSTRILLSTFATKLSSVDFETLQVILSEEYGRDEDGLGRHFLKYRLGDQLRQRLIGNYSNIQQTIEQCSDAPYLASLPISLGLNPIYADSHRSSFEVFRGVEIDMEVVGEKLKLPNRLDFSHFIEGICRLDVDAIAYLRESSSIKEFRNLLRSGVSNEHDHIKLQNAFFEANILIENKIINAFPFLKTSTLEPEARVIERKIASVRQQAGFYTDLLGLAITGYLIGTSVNFIIDAISSKISPTKETDNAQIIARHQSQKKELETYLKQRSQDGEIAQVEAIKQTDTFQNETIIY